MNNISQTTFSKVFSSMEMFEFRLKFHWSLFPRVELTIFQHWFRYWLGVVQATSHYLNQWWLVHRRIYASLGLNELTYINYISIGIKPWINHSIHISKNFITDELHVSPKIWMKLFSHVSKMAQVASPYIISSNETKAAVWYHNHGF